MNKRTNERAKQRTNEFQNIRTNEHRNSSYLRFQTIKHEVYLQKYLRIKTGDSPADGEEPRKKERPSLKRNIGEDDEILRVCQNMTCRERDVT